jgi:hypothetical protein
MSPVESPESGTEAASVALPTPTFEAPLSASSTSSVDAKALAVEVAKILRPEIERTVQSTKDKRIASLEKKLGLTELEELGIPVSPEQRQELRLRDLEARLSSPVQDASQGNGAAPDIAKVAQQVVTELEFDARTPEVIALLSGKYRNEDHFRAEANALKLRQLKQPTPTPAQAPALSGNMPAPESNQELENAYQNDLKAIAANPQLKGESRIREITNLKAKYREKGLDKN